MNICLSIVLPCYNEADNLPLLLKGYRQVWRDLPAELILVDNGSTDPTPAVLARELVRPELAFARTVRVPQNRGYGHGLYTGLRAARGEFVAFSHADMQCSPADVFRAYDRLRTAPNPDQTLVKGQRSGREFSAVLITAGMSLLASTVLLTLLTDINAQPKVFHRSHLDRLTEPPDGFQFDLYVLYRARQAGMKILTIPVVFGERMHGQSKSAFNVFARYRTIWAIVTYIFRLRFGGAT
ncbi:MAG: glycosyltransferase [Anaerolineales bacterium]|nr:glycosyltransferase [Anaerolineales bacterium]